MEIPDLGNLTATAILCWYAWHTASHTIPQLMRDFREELAAGRQECQFERDLLRRELCEERAQRHTDNQAIVAALEQVVERLGG
ncbi:MAG TPA: hypothetical protein VFE24_15080 [Pirellulales bacterium]|jgi:hypothetical protein|nr:hypothetical protein [Pirellulales bacterium]